MEIRASEFKEWGYCYDEQCADKKKELTTALKEYTKEAMKNVNSRCCNCYYKNEYVQI